MLTDRRQYGSARNSAPISPASDTGSSYLTMPGRDHWRASAQPGAPFVVSIACGRCRFLFVTTPGCAHRQAPSRLCAPFDDGIPFRRCEIFVPYNAKMRLLADIVAARRVFRYRLCLRAMLIFLPYDYRTRPSAGVSAARRVIHLVSASPAGDADFSYRSTPGRAHRKAPERFGASLGVGIACRRFRFLIPDMQGRAHLQAPTVCHVASASLSGAFFYFIFYSLRRQDALIGRRHPGPARHSASASHGR
jgi:hypothetical protein